MIDLHSHILPGIDDGARDIADSLEIARQSLEIGVSKMMCTPHIHQGVFDNTTDTISNAFQQLYRALQENNIPLKISIGSEIRLDTTILSGIKNNSIPFIGDWLGKSALLLELPHSHVPPGAENLIRWLIKNDIQPVIPHPERNRDIMSDYSKLRFLRRHGCIFQVTAGAFVGRFSETSKDVAIQMLEDDFIAYVASDTHSVKRRPNDMLAAKEAIATLKNEETAKRLTFETPNLLTQNVEWH